jgi:mono/diheme cytochrome c family protein
VSVGDPVETEEVTMRWMASGLGLAVAVGLRSFAAAGPDPPPEPRATPVGEGLYREHCASCHGLSGKGDGLKSTRTEVAPPDLTRIARRNRGKFPFDRVVRIVDGREIVKGHGGAGMPIWADALLRADERYDQARVKERIREIVRYLESIQTSDQR